MHPVEKHLLDTELAGLEGTRIEGTIAFSNDLVNAGLLEMLAKLKAPAAPQTTTDTTSSARPATTPIDPAALLKKLDVKVLRYRTEAGKTLVDVKGGFG